MVLCHSSEKKLIYRSISLLSGSKVSLYSHRRACVLSCSVVSDSATPWTVAHPAPLSMGFPRQGHWSGLPCSPPGDLPNPGIEPVSLMSPALQADYLLLIHQGHPHSVIYSYQKKKKPLWIHGNILYHMLYT